jgi:ABC-type taurine transport system substrate-binding protein
MRKVWCIGLALAFGAGIASAQQKEVTIAYQDMLDPYRVSQDAKDL